MDSVMFTLPIALMVAGVFLSLFYWAFRQGQFDNLEGPAERMIHDNEDQPARDLPDHKRERNRA